LDDCIPVGDAPPLFADGQPVRGTPEVVELLDLYQVPYVKLTGPIEAVLGGYLGPALNQPTAPLGVIRHRYLDAIDLLRRLKLGEPLPDPPMPAIEGAEWSCSGCGEDNPSNFEICWNCGQSASR
jgi:hypothetical protein